MERTVLGAIAAGLVVLTLFVFFQVRSFDFVNWDDPIYITENANVRAGLSWSNVAWALTTTHSPYWHPVTWLSHMLDVTLFGMDAGWHHVTSLVVHLASTLLLFALLRRMTGEEGKSAFVAAIFAVHPLHVESVAWLAERKDVLSTFLSFCAIWTYVRYVERPGRARYAAIVFVYALALMAKPMVVTLPFALLLLDVWPLRRIGRPEGLRYDPGRPDRLRRGYGESAEALRAKAEGLRYESKRTSVERNSTNVAQALRPAFHDTPSVAQALRPALVLLEKLPLLALAIGVSVATLLVQKDVGAVAGLNALPLGARVANALVGYVTYLWKTFWPARLAAFYPLRAYPAWLPALAAAILAVLTLIAFTGRRERPYVWVGWLWFLITVAPVIGLMQSGEQAAADRFMYVPMIGLLFIVAWGGDALLKRAGIGAQGVGVMAFALIIGCAVVARAQTAYWADSRALWRHAAGVTDGNYVAYEKIGEALRDRGQFDEAAANYDQALKYAPANSPVYAATIQNSLGLVRTRQGRPDDAERHFAEAARLNPRFAEAQNNYGNALAAEGRFDEAIEHYRAALAIQPQFTEAVIGLGGSLVREGRPDEAAAQYREALRLDPNLAQAHNGLGSAYTLLHRDDEAMAEFNRALELKPDLPSAHLNIAILLLRKNDVVGARRHLETALSIDPGYEPARNVLARIR